MGWSVCIGVLDAILVLFSIIFCLFLLLIGDTLSDHVTGICLKFGSKLADNDPILNIFLQHIGNTFPFLQFF